MKTGDKYVIEIEEVIRRNGAPQIARIKGFNALVFDEYGLDKLEPYDNDLKKEYLRGYNNGYKAGKSVVSIPEIAKRDIETAYDKGLNEAWEVAKWLYNNPVNIVEDIFNCEYWEVYSKHTAQEVVHKIKEYEDEHDEIKVGDEVVYSDKNHPRIVTNIFDDAGIIKIVQLSENGKYVVDNIKDIHKTGRHFPQIAEVLAELRGEE